MNEYDLLSIGDVTLDVFVTPTESETLCQMHDKDELICFSFGDKIPVKHIEFSVGGNAANNTVGATRMGLKAGLVTTLGGDMIGNQIVEKLDKEGVDLTYAIRQPTANTNYSTVINFGGERTIFSYHAPRSYEFPVHLPVASWIYLTSMGETFRPFYNHFVSWIKKHPEIKLAFNPGSRQLRAGYDAMKDVLEVTHVIYVNRREAKKITGKEDLDDKELLKALHALGPKICIITAGPEGSFVYDGERFVKAGILPVDSFERTGAGDAFGSGCISALVKGKSFEEALLWGTVNSASVIGYVGSQKGLLRESDIGVWLERAKSSKVEVGEF
jgi:sugar/nucleoside kinase (ribokinase family)